MSQLLNIGVQYRIDSDVNKQMVYRLIWRYITQHPYTNKLIINIFNAGDAAVFADNLVMLERDTANTPFDIHYEIRMFCDDKRFPQGEALRDLLNPDTQVSEKLRIFLSQMITGYSQNCVFRSIAWMNLPITLINILLICLFW